MRIRVYWPNCSLTINQNILFNDEDAFFLECSLDEAEKQVFPRLTEKQRLESLEYHRPNFDPKMQEFGFDTTKLCFLISQNLSQIHPVSWYYPYSHMWNGYSPFQSIEEFNFKHLNEIETWIPKPVHQ